jgi:hypothetical protein
MTKDQLTTALKTKMIPNDDDTIVIKQISENEMVTSSATWMASRWSAETTGIEIVNSLDDADPWKQTWQDWVNEGLI